MDSVFAAYLGMLAIQFSLSIPGSIVIAQDGLKQLYWFRNTKRIRWAEIVEINTGQKSRTVTITGINGSKIVHSTHLADRPRLLLELKNHCGDNLPPDFPREHPTE